ncbi:MAG: alpha-galactosidase [Saccharofermentanaceae bacterium]|nr:alpha-galactosidase [Saccharofermentanaceae bacterium]
MKRTQFNISVSGDTFRIDTKNTSYMLGVRDGLFLGHFYYGPRIIEDDISYRSAFAPEGRISRTDREMVIFMDGFRFEYPGWGAGDSREGALKVQYEDGTTRVCPLFRGYEISSSKAPVPGLPSTYAAEGEVGTLRIDLADPDTDVEVSLFYSAFYEEDVIARRVEVRNGGDGKMVLQRVLSAAMDMPGRDMQGRPFELLTFHGTWAREFTRQIDPIPFGRIGVSSICGKTGNRAQSFLGIVSPGITQEEGEVYGLQFLYSGNFSSMVEKCPNEDIRVSVGIHPEEFSWVLMPGETFYAPEVVMTYSDHGLGRMSRSFHDLYRRHLIRGKYKEQKRPILINNWEATYFDFNTEKLLRIARQAKDCGIEMLVVDDGWFGKRNDDNTSLGDWTVNEEKLPGGLSVLSSKLKEIGMKLGVWFEPEMVSPDSDLYRAHPDWAITIPGIEPSRSRNQLVLDVSREDVRDYLFSAVSDIIREADVAYVKWDMNRQLSDLYSAALPAERQGELLHRFVLGVYDLQERLLTAFPDLLLENCSSGGARFDPGMLYYSPQIWTSDDTDAYERIRIQEGAATLYPLSSLGAHVSICPNHVTGRNVPFMTRGHVALAGTFGYELDITKLSEEDLTEIKRQTVLFHRYNDLIRNGDYYRIASVRDNGAYDCYGVVSKDKSEMLLTFIHVINRPCTPNRFIHLKGLDGEKRYRVTWAEDPEEQPEVVAEAYGSTLMNAGLTIPCMNGDFRSVLYYIEEI